MHDTNSAEIRWCLIDSETMNLPCTKSWWGTKWTPPQIKFLSMFNGTNSSNVTVRFTVTFKREINTNQGIGWSNSIYMHGISFVIIGNFNIFQYFNCCWSNSWNLSKSKTRFSLLCLIYLPQITSQFAIKKLCEFFWVNGWFLRMKFGSLNKHYIDHDLKKCKPFPLQLFTH